MPHEGVELWGPTLATIGLFLCLAWLPPGDVTRPGARLVRVAAAVLTAALTARYFVWRVQAVPAEQSVWQNAWAIGFLAMEVLNMVSGLCTLLFMSRTLDRSAEADATSDSPLHAAPTDVLIATFNESRAVLERTIICALDIDHPDLRVWVLDDGARPGVRELAEGLGAYYIARVDGRHAKAGNINDGLNHILATGRRPDFILLLDADFIPSHHFLRRTLGLFEAPDVGIVQTPQHFFNPDPIQVNLACDHVWPDEQRFFFNVLLPCKDAWGAAFCCGTSAVLRVAALEAVGGMATETVTEDTLTSFKMEEYGWRTVFLNERLSLGLAPEGVGEYVTQRGRWCLGAIQQLHTRWSFFGRGRIRLITRISSFDVSLYWIASFLFKLMMLASPAIYWWTGTSVIAATMNDVVYWLLPSALASTLFMSIFGRNLIVPIMTDITQLLSSVVVIGNVTVGLLRPHGRRFKVTPKGVSRDRITVQWVLMWPFVALAVATIAGLAMNASASSPLTSADGYGLNVFWSLFNTAVLAWVCMACVEMPRRRLDERFVSNERGVVIWPGHAGTECIVRDISLGGARLAAPGGLQRTADAWRTVQQGGTLALDDGRVHVPFRLLRRHGAELVVRFENTPIVRRILIGRLFTGAYALELQKVSAYRVLGTLLRRLLG